MRPNPTATLIHSTPVELTHSKSIPSVLSLIHSLTHSLTHPPTYSLTCVHTHLLTHLCTYPLTHSLTHSHNHFCTYSLTGDSRNTSACEHYSGSRRRRDTAAWLRTLADTPTAAFLSCPRHCNSGPIIASMAACASAILCSISRISFSPSAFTNS